MTSRRELRVLNVGGNSARPRPSTSNGPPESTQTEQYWRSLEELTGAPEFDAAMHREFPDQASEFNDSVGRRKFLKLMGASLALAGASACTVQPGEKIVPYVRQPEEIIPGKPLFFATAMTLSGLASGLLVESHMGRPTKIEGNPEHPINLGAADIFAQASVLSLYDQDRSQTVTKLGDISTWLAMVGSLTFALDEQRAFNGSGIRLLTETVTSPTLASQIKQLQSVFPAMKWHQYEPASRSNAIVGAQMAFGRPVTALCHFDRAAVVLSLDADFLSSHPANLKYIRDFTGKRALRDGAEGMNRLYVVESTPSNTGAKADHRLSIRPSEMETFARAVASGVGVQAGAAAVTGELMSRISPIVRELQENRGASLVIAGDHQPPIIHALAHAMNRVLGNVGKTVTFVEPPEANPVDQIESLRDLARDLEKGAVDVLMILGGNPVFTAPADLNFSELVQRAKFSAHLSMYNDETSAFCQWHIPEAHFLESWSDVRALDGTITVVQPLILPLYNGKTAHEVLAAFLGQHERPSYDIVREYWIKRVTGQEAKSTTPPVSFEKFWRKALHDGVVAASASRPVEVSAKTEWPLPPRQDAPSAGGQFEVIFRPDPSIYDGRFANNGWLQELPKPMTKLTWDNAALISKRSADSLGLSDGDMVRLVHEGRTVRAPIMVMPGQADNCITLHYGYGRSRAGRVGSGTGFNAFALRTSGSASFAAGVELHKEEEKYKLATTQHHWVMEGRDLVRSGTLSHYREEPEFARERVEEPARDLTLYQSFEYPGYAWGMAIDLTSCVGCNACVVACQSENNIPVVGKEQVHRGREMHWLRVDRYYEGSVDEPNYHFMPVPCMHCENAPCEVVCPVAATVHSAEGTNDMVYNRCVGTRYCSNNCPYKVRRFNFLLYQDFETEGLKMLRNPDVTVRSRGVMEKCTYCIQRIQLAKIEAEKQNRPVADGEINTACQQTCPADAIVFGNINDPSSRVARLRAEPRHYGLLAELNTRPRTTYLASVKNPNAELDHG